MTNKLSHHIFDTTLRTGIVVVLLAVLSACNTISQLSEIGDGPKLTQITNPKVMPDYRPVSLPMPNAQMRDNNPNSLWQPGARAFFKDHRAKDLGDIVTVKLSLDDKATLANSTNRSRNASEDSGVTNMLGLENTVANTILPEGYNLSNALTLGSNHSTSGDGSIDRSEKINLTFAAVVTQILPNGSLVILGRQELRVNSELRELMVTGVVRPEDIDSDNTVPHERIAEMRVAYGGRGTLSNLQQARWGTQIWDVIFPF